MSLENLRKICLNLSLLIDSFILINLLRNVQIVGPLYWIDCLPISYLTRGITNWLVPYICQCIMKSSVTLNIVAWIIFNVFRPTSSGPHILSYFTHEPEISGSSKIFQRPTLELSKQSICGFTAGAQLVKTKCSMNLWVRFLKGFVFLDHMDSSPPKQRKIQKRIICYDNAREYFFAFAAQSKQGKADIDNIGQQNTQHQKLTICKLYLWNYFKVVFSRVFLYFPLRLVKYSSWQQLYLKESEIYKQPHLHNTGLTFGNAPKV